MAIYATLLNGVNIASGGVSSSFDLSAYSSIIVWSLTPLTAGHFLTVEDVDSLQQVAAVTSPADALGNTAGPVMIPVRGRAVRIHNQAAATVAVNVRATTRAVPQRRPLLPGNPVDVFTGNFGAAIGTETMGYISGGGLAFLSWNWNTAAWRGRIQLLTKAGVVPLSDTTDTHADPTGGNTVYKQIIAPMDSAILQVKTIVAGVGSQTATLTYAEL